MRSIMNQINALIVMTRIFKLASEKDINTLRRAINNGEIDEVLIELDNHTYMRMILEH